MVKLTDIQERPLYGMAALPVPPFAQRAGYTNQKVYKTDRDRTLDITLGQLGLVGLQESYLDSYNSAVQPTVLQYRDLMMAKAIEASLYNAQYLDGANTNPLTEHAKKVWSYYSYNDLWDYITPGEEVEYPYLWSGLGTPAYYFYYSRPNAEEGLVKSYERLLTFFWATLGCSHKTQPPRQRLQYLIDSVGLTETFLNRLESYNDRVALPAYFKRNNIGKITQLKPALLLNHYESEYFAVVLEGVDEEFKREFSSITKAILSIARPGGLLYVMQFLIVEAYIKITRALTVDLPLGRLPLEAYLTLNTLDAISTRQSVTKWFGLASDAHLILNWYNGKQDSFLRSNLTLWLSYLEDKTIPYDSEYRLTNFNA